MSEPLTNESELRAGRDRLASLRTSLQGVLFGQEDLIDLVVIGMLCRGHVLLEGLPGLGKTELVKAIGRAVTLETRRIQFTPDLLPGDITGNPILQVVDGVRRFVFQPGPLFGNLVLADEINRASPKTQSALLEAMQEHRVTVLGETHPLPDPFFVLATQNPIELEGTYPLPEAQLDRFLFKLEVTRGGVDVLERIIKQREIGIDPPVDQVMSKGALVELIQMARRIYLPDVVANYIARLVDATHAGSGGILYGASPRAALAMTAAGKARALLDGRLNVGFEDIQAVAVAVLRHRLVLNYDAKLDGQTGEGCVRQLLTEMPTLDRDLPATLGTAAQPPRLG